ncbi:hypothetical protein [Nocardioides sp. REDSEA-S30_B4]|uniref:hypothetical protein n=1 Tax=Nocardioides sp. REDSEA-S30_B4 TaxID=1811552 RepID=UPI000AEDF3F9|nr:hypothetical protein [Nocardioides sp. REDSEA-S30_B4]
MWWCSCRWCSGCSRSRWSCSRDQIAGALAARFAEDVTARVVSVDGTPTVVVTVRASVPALGLGGPGVDLEVDGHAVQELQP